MKRKYKKDFKNMNEKTIQIRQMQSNDFLEVLSLWKKANLTISNPIQEKYEVEKMVKLNSSSCLVAVEKEKIVGSIFGVFDGRRAWIYHLAVHPEWQKQGLGKELIKKVEKVFRQKGATTIYLWVDFKNLKVLPFYEKCGYKIFDPISVLLSKQIKTNFEKGKVYEN